jgi:hypothetical protein
MQGVRGSNPLSSTRHNASAALPLRAVCQQIVSRSLLLTAITLRVVTDWAYFLGTSAAARVITTHLRTLTTLKMARRPVLRVDASYFGQAVGAMAGGLVSW